MSRDEVLIVDDDADMAEVMELVLQAAGYTTRTAPNGLRALEEVASGMPSLILLDMLMPVMNGWDFVRAFRDRYGAGVPIVIVSAAEHLPRRCEGLEAAAVLGKPFDVDELLRVVDQHLGGQRSDVRDPP